MPNFSKLRLGDGISDAETAKRSALSQGQVVALLDACADPALKLYVAIMAACGLRPGEAVGLRWRDVDSVHGALHVRGAAKAAYGAAGEAKRVWIGATKTRGSVRDIATGPALIALFDAEQERQEAYQRALLGGGHKVRGIKLLPSDAVVFPSDPATADGLTIPVDPETMRKRFKRAAGRAGIAGATPHWLRHTSISHAIEGGLSLADTAARAGHSSVMTTAKTYVHAVNESQRKAALIGDSILAKVEQPVNEKPESPGHK
jgi:integrase